MVFEKEHGGGKVYICYLCGYGYRDRETAERCEEWCAVHKSCNIEITKNAVYIPET